jgi:hypothetical protein
VLKKQNLKTYSQKSLLLVFIIALSFDVHCQELSQRLESIVKKNIDRAEQALPKMEQKMEEVGEFIRGQKNADQHYGQEGPSVNPLDKNGGHLDKDESWSEYVADSMVTLNRETFPQCLEPRLVAEYNGQHRYWDIPNIAMGLACEFNCHLHVPFVNPIYYTQHWKVISYYWPEYQISVNKSGAQMIDVDIVPEMRGELELYRKPTARKEDRDPEQIRGEDQQLDMLDRMGIPRSAYKDPTYHKEGEEYHLQQDGEVRYGSSMRTNVDAQSAHDRPDRYLGYDSSPKCLFNALNVKTDEKKVIHNRFDQGIYAVAARYPETRLMLDQRRYRLTSPQAMKLDDYKQETPLQFRESLCASWRMGSNQAVYGDLEKVDFKPVNSAAYRDYCLPGGYDLSLSMLYLENTPRLQADAARAVMSAIAFSSKQAQYARMNREPIRPNYYTMYEKRTSSSVDRYVGSGIKQIESNPGENNSKIVFVDKIQRIYPTQEMGKSNFDGEGGTDSANDRVSGKERGSHCFRPEDIPNWSSEGKTNVSEWPLGLMRDVRYHKGESRWAVWNRRVLCSCQIRSLPWGLGCLNLNDGDKPEAGFLGPIPFMQEMPPPFKKAIAPLKINANKKTPPSGGGPAYKGYDIPIVDIQQLGAGLSAPDMPN